MMRSIKVWSIFAVVALLVGMILSGRAAAQGDPTPSVSDLQTQVAEQQATIKAQQTKSADPKPTEKPRPKATVTPNTSSVTEINETTTIKDTFDIVVTGYEFVPTINLSYYNGTARGQFLIVTATLTNLERFS